MNHKIRLNPAYTFENLVEGDYNRFMISFGKKVSRDSGRESHNPLVIYGENGVGKTHLAQAIGNDVLLFSPEKRVVYTTSDELTNNIISAIKSSLVEDFVASYQNIDVFIIDNVQFLSAKPKTQEIVFYIFNQLREENKQIIIVSDLPPREIEGINEKLMSRFELGTSGYITFPGFYTLKEIAKHKINMLGIKLGDDLIDLICQNIRNVHELEGALTNLLARSEFLNKKIDLDLVKKVIDEQEELDKSSFHIKIPSQIRTAIKQYLVFFNEYSLAAKGKSFQIEIKDFEKGIIVSLPMRLRTTDFEDCFKEYLSFTRMRFKEITPFVETEISERKNELLIMELRNQVQFLKTSLKIKEVESRVLNETVGTFKDLLLVEKSNPQLLVIRTPLNSFETLEENFNRATFELSNNTEELLDPQIANELKEEISRGNIKYVLEKLISISKNNHLVLIKSQWARAVNDFNLNIISNDFFNREINKICKCLLDYIDIVSSPNKVQNDNAF